MADKKPGSSVQPRKQRFALYTADIHQRRHIMSAHLSEDLMVQYKRRSVPLRTGDTIKVIRGDFKGKTAQVLRVDRKRYLIEVDGVTVRRANGTEVARPIHPSNVIITKLDLSDAKRRDMLARKGVTVKAQPAKQAAKKRPAAAASAAGASKGTSKTDERSEEGEVRE